VISRHGPQRSIGALTVASGCSEIGRAHRRPRPKEAIQKGGASPPALRPEGYATGKRAPCCSSGLTPALRTAWQRCDLSSAHDALPEAQHVQPDFNCSKMPVCALDIAERPPTEGALLAEKQLCEFGQILQPPAALQANDLIKHLCWRNRHGT
jgi:hypothetical protein